MRVSMHNVTFSFYEWRCRMQILYSGKYKLTKAECARMLAIDPHTYAKYENDPASAPKAYKLAAIALLMGYHYEQG